MTGADGAAAGGTAREEDRRLLEMKAAAAAGAVAAELMPGGWPSDGVALRQENARREGAPCCPCGEEVTHARNTYRVVPLPPGARVGSRREDPAGWHPTAAELDAMMPSHTAVERGHDGSAEYRHRSGMNFRGFAMRIEGADPASGLYLDREDAVPGCCTMTPRDARVDVYAGGHYLGRVAGDERGCCGGDDFCGPTRLLSVRVPAGGAAAATAAELGAPPRQRMERSREAADAVPLVEAYSVRRTDNGAGALPSLARTGVLSEVFRVLDPATGRRVGSMESRTQVPVVHACCQPKQFQAEDKSTMLVGFPQGAPPGHRALLLAAALEIDYRMFQDNGYQRGTA